MELLNLVQGSQEWLEVRLNYFTASEAPIMMGASPHMSRDDLRTYKTTKQEEEVGRFQQMIYDKGHELEEMARPIAERMIGEELYPVTGIEVIEGLPLLASFDGLDLMEVQAFEHKQWNAEKAKTVNDDQLGAEYYWQLEHQLLVSSAEKSLFVMSDGTEENLVYLYYKSKEDRRKQLISGWKQFQQDLEGYQPKVYEIKPEANAIAELPALSIQLMGKVQGSNLPAYKSAALQLIEGINTNLVTDQDFVDADAMIKHCEKAEKELEVVKKQALSQTADIDKLFRTIDELKEAMRSKRLDLNKLVKQKKEQIRLDVVNQVKQELADQIANTNKLIAPIILPEIDADFFGAIKGKRTVKSLNEAANDELAKAKIKVNELAKHIQFNLESYQKLSVDHEFLFSDLQQIIMKESADFVLLVESRIDKHERAKEHREANATKTEKTAVEAVATSPEVEKTVDKVEVIEANNDEADIVHYLYTHHGIYAEPGRKIAEAIILGRVPHVQYNQSIKSAA